MFADLSFAMRAQEILMEMTRERGLLRNEFATTHIETSYIMRVTVARRTSQHPAVLHTIATSSNRSLYGAFCVIVQKAVMDFLGNGTTLYLRSFLVSTPEQFDRVIDLYGPPMRFVSN
jgi:hypothetical protein